MKRILLVCSSGGHLDQLLIVLPAFNECHVAIATFDKPDALDKVGSMPMYPLRWPTNRNLLNLIRNARLAVKCLRAERPDMIISSGAAAAVPFFFVGKALFKTTNIFIECFDRIEHATLTAKLVRPATDFFVVQWPSQLRGWSKRIELGPSR